MRHTGTILFVALILAASGCKKAPQGPQTTALEPPSRQLDYLQPLEPEPAQPPAETAADAQAPAGAEAPVAVEAAASEQPAPPVAPEPATPQPAQTPKTYTIQKGDTLWSIAKRHLGNGKRWTDIVAANPGLDTQKLSIGQTIALPAK